jgi:transposase-like protein
MTTLANIREGTSKYKVAEVFKAKDKDAAIKKGLALGLQESTVRTWCSQWKNGGGKKTAKKAAPAKKAVKAAPAKKAAKKAAPRKRERVEERASA